MLYTEIRGRRCWLYPSLMARLISSGKTIKRTGVDEIGVYKCNLLQSIISFQMTTFSKGEASHQFLKCYLVFVVVVMPYIFLTLTITLVRHTFNSIWRENVLFILYNSFSWKRTFCFVLCGISLPTYLPT